MDVKHGDIKYPHVCSIHFHGGKLSRMIYSLKTSGVSERAVLRFYFRVSHRIQRRTSAILQVLCESLARSPLTTKNERRKDKTKNGNVLTTVESDGL